MEHTLKRLLSLAVALFMVISMIPASALPVFAAEEVSVEETTIETTAPAEIAVSEEDDLVEYPEGWSVEYHCVCGNPGSTGNPCAEGGHKMVQWKPWTITDAAPFLDGYWYLSDDLDLTGKSHNYSEGFPAFGKAATGMVGYDEKGYTVSGTVNVYVDLNGKTLTGMSGHRIYRIDAAHNLTITDTVGTGKLVGKSSTTNTNAGIVIWTRNAGTAVTIYGGTLDGSGVTIYSATGAAYGATINNCAALNVYGGTIIGGTANGATARGGNIYNIGTLNIHGGTVTGGTGTGTNVQGGNIYNGGTLNIHGGTVTGGTATANSNAQGANIRNEGTLNIYGGTISGGVAQGSNTQGGNVSNVKTFYMEGGTIEGGSAIDTDGGNGGSFFSTTGGTMKGGTITGGSASASGTGTSYRGGCVYLYGGTFTMSGNAAISNGTAWQGGNIYVNTNAVLNIDGGTVSGGLAASGTGAVASGNEGGNVYTLGTVTMNGGLVTNAARTTSSAYRGASFYAGSGGKITINEGTVVAGRATDFGGAIGTQGGGTITVAGGVITAKAYADGTPVTNPADAHASGVVNLCSAAGATIGTWDGTVNISGGTVIGGTMGGAGGAVLSVHGGTKATISGGLLTGATGSGTDPLRGGAISVYGSGSKLTMTGGTVTDNRINSGAIYVRNSGAIEVSGDVVINGNYTNTGVACNLNLSNLTATSGTYSQCLVIVGNMGSKADIGVTTTATGAFTTAAVSEANAAAFVGDGTKMVTQLSDGTLSLVDGHAGHCVCGGTYEGCDHTALEGEWKPWNGKSAISEGGNYYLTQSLTGSTQYWMGGSSGNTTEMTINLCLNGYSIDSEFRVFGVAPNVTFNLHNCKYGESVLTGCSDGTDAAGVIFMYGTPATMSIYDNIKIVAKTVSGRNTSSGGAMNVVGTVNLYGTEVVGKSVTGSGGAINVSGTLNMYNGKISGGIANGANGGGNVYLNNGATFNAYNCEIVGGIATAGHGGNIKLMQDAVCNIQGGKVIDGKVIIAEDAANKDLNGGNIAMVDQDNDNLGGLTISGNAEISGGHANRGGNIFIHTGTFTVKDNVKILGGTEDGYSSAGAPCVEVNWSSVESTASNRTYVVISGTPEITDIRRGDTIDFTGLEAGAKIGVNRKAAGKVSSGALSDSIADGITSTNENLVIVNRADAVYAVDPATLHVHDKCVGTEAGNCDHSSIYYKTPVTDVTQIVAPGNYYLDADITDAAELTISGSGVVNLCLNGHSWSGAARTIVVSEGVTLNISNCSETESVLSGVGTADTAGGVICVNKDAALNVYGNVVLQRAANTTVTMQGGIIDANGNVGIYGATLDGQATKAIALTGGLIRMEDAANLKLTIVDAVLKNGWASNGGAIMTNAATTVTNITNTTIENCTATYTGGGAIYIFYGTVNLNEGTVITGCKATGTKAGGSIYVGNGTLNINEGATITGGSAGWGGNIAATGTSAKVVMTGGTVTGGTATSTHEHGGNIYVHNGAQVTITGGEVSNGQTTGTGDANGGNIAISGASSKLTIGGNAVIKGGKANRGGSIFLHTGVISIEGNARIENGVAETGSTSTNGGYAPGVLLNNTMTGANTLTISGSPYIEELYVHNSGVIVGNLNSNAYIGVNRTNAGAVSTAALSADTVKHFTSTNEDWKLVNEETALFLRALDYHVYGEGEQTKAPSCTEEGTLTYTCKYCGHIKTESIDALEHTVVIDEAVQATCTQTGLTEGSHCESCGVVLVEQKIIPKTELTYVAEVTATCHQNGTAEYWYCAECDIVFADANATQQTNIKNLTIEATVGLTHVAAEEAGCHQNGHAEYWYCAECEAVFADAAGTQLTNIKNLTVEANPLTHVEAVEASCHQNGMSEYWYCEECEAVFSDAAGIQLTNRQNLVIPYTAEIIHVEAVEASCHQTGNVEHWYCAECEAVFTDAALTQISNFKSVVIPSTAEIIHVEAVEVSCHQNGSAEYWYCAECEAVFADAALTQLTNIKNLTVPAQPLTHVEAVAATCEQNGCAEYWYCETCDAVFADAAGTQLTNRLNLTVPADGHIFTSYEAYEAATNVKNATEISYCDNDCGAFQIREIANSKINGVLQTGVVYNTGDTGAEDGSYIYFDIGQLHATESILIEVYSGNTKLAFVELNKAGIDKDYLKQPNLSAKVEITAGSTSWDTTWYIAPVENIVPDKAVLYVDGYQMNSVGINMYNTDFPDQAREWGDIDGVKAYGLPGGGTQGNPYVITTKEEMFLFAELVNNGTYKNVYVVLGNDIDLEQDDWTSIGTDVNRFTGTFDGQGYTIRNLWGGEGCTGLFGSTSTGNIADNYGDKALITNFTLENVTIISQGKSAVGGVVGQGNMSTIVTDVKVTGTVEIYGYGYVGGIMGQGYATIDNCHVDGISAEDSVIDASFWAVAGILGHGGGSRENGMKISNCSVKNISINSAYYGAASILGQGGGTAADVTAENVNITAGSEPAYNGLLSADAQPTGDSWVKNVELTVDGTSTNGCGDIVAEVNGIGYVSLEAAVAAAQNNDTVTLLNHASGAGVVINKSITIDFGGYTYTFTSGVGSGTLTSNGLQILKDNTVTLKNGKLCVAEESKDLFYTLIQNYADLTVEDMVLDGTNLDKWANHEDQDANGDSFTLSVNNGTVNIIGATTIIANNEGSKAFAVDSYDSTGYAGVPTVNINTTGTIGALNCDGGIYSISGGTFTAPVEKAWCAEGFAPIERNGNYVVVAIPELPTATITMTENEELTFSMNFLAVEPSEEQLEFYGKWYADFVLTVNKDVTFNANGDADGYLGGQYDVYGEGWLYVPFEDVTMHAGESLKIMEYAAKLLGQPGLKLTYNDVVTFVKDFDCGVYFTPEFLLANPDLEVTLELRMFSNMDESESYVIGETYVFEAPDYTTTVTDAEGNLSAYVTLADAIAAAEDGDVIQVLDSHSSAGAVINKSITVDFGGNTVELTSGVGSGTLTSNGLQILKDNTVTLKNGKLYVAEESRDLFYTLIQNYADLTVEDMVLDGTNLDKWANHEDQVTNGDSFTLSVNNGTVNIIGATTIIANDYGSKAFAVDSYDSTGYAGVPTVNINTTGTIGALNCDGGIYSVSGGFFTEILEESYCAEGLIPTVVPNENGLYTVEEKGDAVAQNMATGKLYSTVAEALMEAEETDATVKMIADSSEYSIVVPDGVTLELNGKTLTASYVNAFGPVSDSTGNGLLKGKQGRVNLFAQDDYFSVWNGEGYIFITDIALSADTNVKIETTDEGLEFSFLPILNAQMRELLADGGSDNGVKLVVRMSWTGSDGDVIEEPYDVHFNDEFVAKVYSSATARWAFKLTLANAENLNDLTFSIVLVSDTGAELVSQTIG